MRRSRISGRYDRPCNILPHDIVRRGLDDAQRDLARASNYQFLLRVIVLILGSSLLAAEATAQIRNAPSARSIETAAYLFALSNVCGYKIASRPFKDLMQKQGVTVDDIAMTGPLGGRIRTMFTIMSNQMLQQRDAACDVGWREFGEQGTVAVGVVEAR